MPRLATPYGTWPSPITAEFLVHEAVGLSQVELDGDRVHWVESRPAEGGRQVVVRAESDGTTTELLPAGFSARTQVHEYGGRCYTVVNGVLVASNWDDQRLWRFADEQRPMPLTPDPPTPRSERYADPVVTPDRQWVVCVRERHTQPTGDEAERVDNDLVAVALDPGSGAAAPLVLTGGRDFYAAPRVSPDGRELAWLCWDHPNMPWDDTELWRAPLTAGPAGPSLGPATLVVGGHASIAQPQWSPAGVLHHVSDRSGWWNVYAGDRALFPIEAECNEPGWVFGTSTYGFDADGGLVVTWSGPGGAGLGWVVDGVACPIDAGFGAYTSLQVAGRSVVCVAGSVTDPPAVVRIDVDSGRVDVLRRSREVTIDPGFISRPERVRFPTGDGEEAWALAYRPASADHEGVEGTLPPLVVMSHGGPTGAASGVLNFGVQYWTSRGFAVADVDYRGSTGYGRAYRERLRGEWGVLDVEDCAGVARWLADKGRTDGSRAVIRGGSAGGFTTLAALAFTDVFAAGASLYGVADLELLARDTHKFESRYLDRLVGPWPETAELYRARSPIHHLDGFTCPVILFQGLEDKVVPPAQAELIHRALHDRRVPVAYLPFEGEQHGFRRAETVVRVAEAELAFYGRVLGFSPHGAVDVPIDNADRLGPGARGSEQAG
jgi:dipeptidyl aminopeptidase/acylaminoacyl peptidase